MSNEEFEQVATQYTEIAGNGGVTYILLRAKDAPAHYRIRTTLSHFGFTSEHEVVLPPETALWLTTMLLREMPSIHQAITDSREETWRPFRLEDANSEDYDSEDSLSG